MWTCKGLPFRVNLKICFFFKLLRYKHKVQSNTNKTTRDTRTRNNVPSKPIRFGTPLAREKDLLIVITGSKKLILSFISSMENNICKI